MNEYNKALERVLAYLEKREKVRPLGNYYKKKIGLPDFLDIWEVSTEILDERNKIKKIKFHVLFFPDFPLSFPKIFLSKEYFDKFKYVPHLQVDRLICIFQNNSQPNVLLPEKVTEEAIRRAKNILEEGVRGNNHIEYEEEFESYWDSRYSKNDVVNKSFLLLNEKPLKQDFELMSLERPVSRFNYIIHQNENVAINFKSYLKDQKIKYEETTGYLFEELEIFIKPPFNKTNGEVIESIKKLANEEYDKYVSFINNNESKLFLFSKRIDTKIRYFGWFHSPARLNRNGFRSKSLSKFQVLSSFQSTELINRVMPQVYTSQRLVRRSAGEITQNKPNKFAIAGLGSIGSNLIHYLNSRQDIEFKLIDTDILKIENIGRHYLGFKYLYWNKTKALKDFLTQFSPIQKVETREMSVIQLIKQEPSFINECDYLLIAIGESNIEFWIADALKEGKISIPVFFIWVEPYLLGGHCIFINPESKNNYYSLFTKSGLFKFNIVGDYNNELLTLKEAGCQSNYTPYSSNNIQLFLGNLYLKIFEIVNSNCLESKSFSWIGDKGIAKKMNIELSKYSDSFKSNTLTENIL